MRIHQNRNPSYSVLSVLCLTPDIIIAVRVILTFSALHKPPVLIGTVVDDQIHDDLNAKFVCLGKHFIKIFECTKLRHDISVITVYRNRCHRSGD